MKLDSRQYAQALADARRVLEEAETEMLYFEEQYKIAETKHDAAKLALNLASCDYWLNQEDN